MDVLSASPKSTLPMFTFVGNLPQSGRSGISSLAPTQHNAGVFASLFCVMKCRQGRVDGG